MKVLEFMSFDPAWFLTVPGLLITGGVVLLLIALIVFIATSKKCPSYPPVMSSKLTITPP